ncbi:MAG: protein phosphatase CheZ [Magnetospirillum sp.]|nr:protein phosphatase CheZ [Magnetospirillum sp.]
MSVKGVDRDLILRLDAIRQERGDMVPIDEVAEIVRAVLDTLTGDISAGDLRLYRELESLADYIHSARTEIAALRPDEIRSEFIPSATDELDAIIGATEAATNRILDAAEHLEGLSTAMEPQVAERLMEITTGMYEACNFQDLTGQRITKVVRVLKVIEDRVETLVKVFGAGAREEKATGDGNVLTDEDLLNGPQLPDAAPDQAEIDRLLASFD